MKCYLAGTYTTEKLRDHIKMLRDVLDFVPAAIIFEGFDFDNATPASIGEIRAIAKDLKAECWMSATTHRESPRDVQGVPAPVAAIKDEIDVIVAMAHDGKGVHLKLLKDHDNAEVSDVRLALDPTTMLLVKE